MNIGQLTFAIGTMIYVLVATVFEERDLVAELGERYRAYRAQVPAFVPRLPRNVPRGAAPPQVPGMSAAQDKPSPAAVSTLPDALAEGHISELHIGLKGTMSALLLKDLAQKADRGPEGRVRQGRSAGGISYSYRVCRQLMQEGSLRSGEREIFPVEAAIGRRIFRGYARGLSARRIAVDLNKEGIAAPRSGKGPGTGRYRPSLATGSGAPAYSTTNSTSGGWCGTASVS